MRVLRNATLLVLAWLTILAVDSPPMFAGQAPQQTVTMSVDGNAFRSPIVTLRGTTFVPLYYVHRILQIGNIHDTWDSHRQSWLLRADDLVVPNNMLLIPTSEPGKANVYVNGIRIIANVKVVTLTDSFSGRKATYLPFNDMCLLLNHLGFQQSPFHLLPTWNLHYQPVSLPVLPEPPEVVIHAGFSMAMSPDNIAAAERLAPVLPINPSSVVSRVAALSLSQVMIAGQQGTAMGDPHAPLIIYSIFYVYGDMAGRPGDKYVVVKEGKILAGEKEDKTIQYNVYSRTWAYTYNVENMNVYISTNVGKGLIAEIAQMIGQSS